MQHKPSTCCVANFERSISNVTTLRAPRHVTITNPPIIANPHQELLARSPLSKTLLTSIPGIKSLYLGSDFISVTKKPVVKWETIRPLIFEAIMDFYADTPAGFKRVLVESDEVQISDTTILDTDRYESERARL